MSISGVSIACLICGCIWQTVWPDTFREGLALNPDHQPTGGHQVPTRVANSNGRGGTQPFFVCLQVYVNMCLSRPVVTLATYSGEPGFENKCTCVFQD